MKQPLLCFSLLVSLSSIAQSNWNLEQTIDFLDDKARQTIGYSKVELDKRSATVKYSSIQKINSGIRINTGFDAYQTFYEFDPAYISEVSDYSMDKYSPVGQLYIRFSQKVVMKSLTIDGKTTRYTQDHVHFTYLAAEPTNHDKIKNALLRLKSLYGQKAADISQQEDEDDDRESRRAKQVTLIKGVRSFNTVSSLLGKSLPEVKSILKAENLQLFADKPVEKHEGYEAYSFFAGSAKNEDSEYKIILKNGRTVVIGVVYTYDDDDSEIDRYYRKDEETIVYKEAEKLKKEITNAGFYAYDKKEDVTKYKNKAKATGAVVELSVSLFTLYFYFGEAAIIEEMY